jgi:hypothetical protein
MKALSIKEPWVSLISNGRKTIETRTWKTTYRGKLLLCASRKPKSSLSGMAFAISNLVDIRLMTKEDEKEACCKIYDRAHSWFLENITPIKPFPVKGQLGLYDVDYDT